MEVIARANQALVRSGERNEDYHSLKEFLSRIRQIGIGLVCGDRVGKTRTQRALEERQVSGECTYGRVVQGRAVVSTTRCDAELWLGPVPPSNRTLRGIG